MVYFTAEQAVGISVSGEPGFFPGVKMFHVEQWQFPILSDLW